MESIIDLFTCKNDLCLPMSRVLYVLHQFVYTRILVLLILFMHILGNVTLKIN